MRILTTLIFILSLWTTAAQATDFICKKTTVMAAKAEVESYTRNQERINHCDTTNDKFMHCSVSCILALQCYPEDVLIIGVGKEIIDLFTPGDADFQDLKADYRGIDLATSKRARDKRACYQQCGSYYPFLR